ncbi:MAG: hypothetical protein ACFFCH_06730 [Promethearchaeota archaeon]
MTISTNAFLRAMDDIIPVLENSDLRFNVTEVLSETRYEFFAVPHSLSGFGSTLLRSAERTFKDDWGKARDTYDVPAPQVANRLDEIRVTILKGFLEIRNFEANFDENRMSIEEYIFKPRDKIKFIINLASISK